MSKQTPLVFNFSAKSNKKSTPSKKSTLFPFPNENQPPFNYSKRKRNFAELENSIIHNFPEGSSKNIKLSLPKVPSIFSDQTKKPDSKKARTIPKVFTSTDIKPEDSTEAFNTLDKFLYLDEKFSDSDKFSFRNTSLNFTQKSKYDYFLTLSKTPYPDIIISKYKESVKENKEVNILNGLYEDLNIVFITFDNEIYVWNYVTEEVTTFKEINNPITCLHITKPKPGIFAEEIEYIMIVATEIEIYILLVKLNIDKIQIILSDYILDLKTQYLITCIVSTVQRRVFLGSQNNYIFELDYYNASSSSIFRTLKKIKTIERSKEGIINKLIPPFLNNLKSLSYYVKIVVDDTRNILYALKHYVNDSSSLFDLNSVTHSEIEIYDLGISGDQFKRKGLLSQEDIKNNYSYSSHFKNYKNYIILEIFEITRVHSKHNNLLAITLSGLRAFIKLDFTDEGIKYNQGFPNGFGVFQPRPSNTFTILISPIADHSKSMRIEKTEGKNVNELTELIQYKNFFSIGRNLFTFFSKSFSNISTLEYLEYDESISIKSHLDTYFDNNLLFNENVTIIFNLNKEKINISNIKRLPYNNTSDSLLKLMRYNNEETKYYNKFITLLNQINYKDSNNHYSNICMHLYSNQQFIGLEKYLILTTSELITIGKVRPLDRLYEILKENGDDQAIRIEKFICEHSIFETTYMLFVIMCNKNFRFFERKLSMDDKIYDEFEERYNNLEIIKKARIIFLDLISKKSESKILKDETSSFSNVIGQAISEKTFIINHISYSFYMYLSRVSRLFWEESMFNGDPKIFIEEPLKIQDFTNIISIIDEFSETIKEMKNEILVKTNDYYNTLNQADGKSTSEFMSFQNDIEQVLLLAIRLIEVLKFVQSIYNLANIKKFIDKFNPEMINIMFSIKYKDIIRNPKDIIIKQLLEEYLEIVYSDRDLNLIRSKLNQFNENCPSIISKSDSEAIVASILIKFAQNLEDEIQKQNTLNQAIDLISAFPESIRLDKLNKIFSNMNEILMIIRVSCEKAIYLRKILEKENINYDNISSLSIGGSQFSKSKSNYYQEFKECLFYIFKVLTEIQYSFKSPEKLEEDNSSILKNFLRFKKLSDAEKSNLLNQCITEVLRHDDKFLHNMLFDHLNNMNMLDNISNFNSPYIESYLNTLVEIDKTDPKKHESLFKYFYKSNDYENAFKKALSTYHFKKALINFNNVGSNDYYIRLNERKNYCILALNCLDMLVKSGNLDETGRNEKIKMKNSLTEYKLILLIQISEYEQLLSYFNREQDLKRKEILERELFQLDSQKYTIDELYIVAKKYGLFEIVIEILFLMSKFNDKSLNSISKSEIAYIYECHFKKTIQMTGNYPKNIIPILNIILSKNAESKSKLSEKLFPINEMIEIIENLNFQYFEFNQLDNTINDKMLLDIDFENESPYWFIFYINCKLEMTFSKIFITYNDLFEKKINNLTDMIHIYFIYILLSIIIIWSVKVESILKKEDLINRDYNNVEQDKENLLKDKSLIKYFFDKIKKEMNAKDIKHMLQITIYEKIINFIKSAEEKYLSVIEKVGQTEMIPKTSFNFVMKEPIKKENDLKRVSSNDMYSLDSLFDKSQTFKSLIHKTSNSQNPIMRKRNLLEEEN